MGNITYLSLTLSDGRSQGFGSTNFFALDSYEVNPDWVIAEIKQWYGKKLELKGLEFIGWESSAQKEKMEKQRILDPICVLKIGTDSKKKVQGHPDINEATYKLREG